MLLAYRRGLLAPDYKYGIQSRIRERMVLGMINAELIADELKETRNLIYTAVAPALNPKSLNEIQESIIAECKRTRHLLEYDYHYNAHDAQKQTALLSSSKGMVQAFMELQRRGIIKKIEDRLKERENAGE